MKKEYLGGLGKVQTNELYKQQLKSELNCESNQRKNFNNIKYTQKSLVSIIENYNNCVGSPSRKYYASLSQRDGILSFKVRARAGIRFTNASLNPFARGVDLPSEIEPQIGVEGELILNSIRNKSSVLLGLDYATYSSSAQNVDTGRNVFQDIAFDYNAIDLSSFICYSFYLNQESSVFINPGLAARIDASGSIQTQTIGSEITDFGITLQPLIGIGYEYHNWIVDVRLDIPVFVASQSPQASRSLSSGYVGVTIGYNFLN